MVHVLGGWKKGYYNSKSECEGEGKGLRMEDVLRGSLKHKLEAKAGGLGVKIIFAYIASSSRTWNL